MAGMGAAVAAATLMGGGAFSALLAAAVVAQSVVLGGVVLLLGGPTRLSVWGMAAMGAGLVRLMGVLGLGLALDLSLAVDRTPFWLGIVSGSVLVLVLESALIIRVAQAHAWRAASEDGAEHA